MDATESFKVIPESHHKLSHPHGHAEWEILVYKQEPGTKQLGDLIRMFLDFSKAHSLMIKVPFEHKDPENWTQSKVEPYLGHITRRLPAEQLGSSGPRRPNSQRADSRLISRRHQLWANLFPHSRGSGGLDKMDSNGS